MTHRAGIAKMSAQMIQQRPVTGKTRRRNTMYNADNYTVQIGEEAYIPNIDTPEQATELAIRACKENPGKAVYVSWFRSIDGCHGYLNRSGDHEPTGHNWQK